MRFIYIAAHLWHDQLSEYCSFSACFGLRDDAVMAAGNITTTERHVSELQPSTKLHKPSPEPKLSWLKKEKFYTKNKHKVRLLSRRKLEETLGSVFLDFNNGWFVYLEVLSV